MNIIIIEDEVETARYLRDTIKSLRPQLQVSAILDSVECSVEWFHENPSPDLIFSDIQLGDGLAFDIFSQVSIACPVIFCTAYDEFMLQAFKTNGIDYLLKPLNEKELEKSLNKFETFGQSFSKYDTKTLHQVLQEISAGQRIYKNTFLVSYREKLMPMSVGEVSCFRKNDTGTLLYTRDGKEYSMSYTLESLVDMLDPRQFYRANRQCLISRRFIKEVEHYLDRKLLVKLNPSIIEPVVVSKAKASAFLNWLES